MLSDEVLMAEVDDGHGAADGPLVSEQAAVFLGEPHELCELQGQGALVDGDDIFAGAQGLRDVEESCSSRLDVRGADLDEEVVIDALQDLHRVGVLVGSDAATVLLRLDECEGIEPLRVVGVRLGVHGSDDGHGLAESVREELAAHAQDLAEALADGSESADEDPHLRHPSRM